MTEPKPTSLLLMTTPACTVSPGVTSSCKRGLTALIYMRESVIWQLSMRTSGISARMGSTAEAIL